MVHPFNLKLYIGYNGLEIMLELESKMPFDDSDNYNRKKNGYLQLIVHFLLLVSLKAETRITIP